LHTEEANDLAADIRREADTLYKTWLSTSERVRDWQQKLATSTKVSIRFLLYSFFLSLRHFMELFQAESPFWGVIEADYFIGPSLPLLASN